MRKSPRPFAPIGPTHNLVEGAGAAPLAALLQERDRMRGKRVALVVSGGNIDMALFRQWVLAM
jgi:threonine dehydratase